MYRKQWPQLNYFLWSIDPGEMDVDLFVIAKTILQGSPNLQAIGTQKTLFVKSSATQKKIVSLAKVGDLEKIEIV